MHDSGFEHALSILDHEDALSWPSLRADKESAWHGHVSFAHWLVQAMKPDVIVELGSHNGVSFTAFCNSVKHGELPTRCFAIDTWQGDDHAGHYGEEVYRDLLAFNELYFAQFAKLMRSYFDDALPGFADGSVDVLHIDGLHTYEAVKHDFETWLPKLSERGVVLFHDTEVRHQGFGVWRLWAELAERYPHYNFPQSAGLGVVAVGRNVPEPIAVLCNGLSPEQGDALWRRFTEASGQAQHAGMALLSVAPTSAQPHPVGGRRNIALHCGAMQSSAFQGGKPTPLGAVNGVKDGRYGFHTDLEMDPWWMVDLGAKQRVSDIVIYNRLDDGCKARASRLSVLISADAEDWDEVYVHDGSVFGGVDGHPLTIHCDQSAVRFVRVRLNDYQFLHLDEVEVYS